MRACVRASECLHCRVRLLRVPRSRVCVRVSVRAYIYVRAFLETPFLVASKLRQNMKFSIFYQHFTSFLRDWAIFLFQFLGQVISLVESFFLLVAFIP